MWDRLDRDGSRLELFKSCGYGGFDLVIASDCLFFKARGGGNEGGERGGGGVYSRLAGSLSEIIASSILLCICLYVCLYGHTYSKSKDQLGKVANPARGQLNRKNEYFPLLVRSLRIWSRETGSAVLSRVSLLISILRLNLVLTYGILPEFRGGVH